MKPLVVANSIVFWMKYKLAGSRRQLVTYPIKVLEVPSNITSINDVFHLLNV